MRVVPTDGGGPSTVLRARAPDLVPNGELAVDATHVYAGDGADVVRVPLTGGDPVARRPRRVRVVDHVPLPGAMPPTSPAPSGSCRGSRRRSSSPPTPSVPRPPGWRFYTILAGPRRPLVRVPRVDGAPVPYDTDADATGELLLVDGELIVHAGGAIVAVSVDGAPPRTLATGRFPARDLTVVPGHGVAFSADRPVWLAPC